MIGRMRPFTRRTETFQKISNMYGYFFVHIILHGFSVNSRWWGEGEMMRPSVQGVDPPVCCTPGCYCYICKRQLCGFPQCAASWMTYARDSFVDSQGGLLSSRGGGGGPRHIGTSLTVLKGFCSWHKHWVIKQKAAISHDSCSTQTNIFKQSQKNTPD